MYAQRPEQLARATIFRSCAAGTSTELRPSGHMGMTIAAQPTIQMIHCFERNISAWTLQNFRPKMISVPGHSTKLYLKKGFLSRTFDYNVFKKELMIADVFRQGNQSIKQNITITEIPSDFHFHNRWNNSLQPLYSSISYYICLKKNSRLDSTELIRNIKIKCRMNK